MCFCIRPCGCLRYACLKSTLCMLLHLSALIALMRGLTMSPPRCPCPVFCMYLFFSFFFWNLQDQKVHRYVGSSQLVGCDNVCCSSLVLRITAGSRRFPAVNSQSIFVPFGLVNLKKMPVGPWVPTMDGWLPRVKPQDLGRLTWAPLIVCYHGTAFGSYV